MEERNYFITWTKQQGAFTLPVERAEDFSFYLTGGQKVIDAVSSAYNVNFGYSEQIIKEKINKILEVLPAANSKWTFDLKEDVSIRLKNLLGFKAGKIFYTVSGAESVENALKVARDTRGKNIVLSRSCSYHGASLGALSVSGDWRNQAARTVDNWTVRIPEPADDPEGKVLREIIKKTGADNIAAFCLETITGANGVIEAPHSWWKEVQSICKETGIILILDEVLSGFMRTGSNFAFQKYTLQPEIVCMSKGISGGYVPFGALWINESVANHYNTNILACGLTAYAHPLGLAALSGVLEILENKEQKAKISKNIESFSLNLNKLKEEGLITNLREAGMLAYFEIGFKAELTDFVEQGIYLSLKNNSIILAPALTISDSDLNELFTKLAIILKEKA